jgi:hypothetical protein
MSKAGGTGGQGRGGRGEGRAPGGRPSSKEANDERSRALNPNNHAWKDMLDNRSRQLDPEHDTSRASRGGRR